MQAKLVATVVPDTAEAGCVTVAFTVPVQPLTSVIVTEYEPAVSPILSSVVTPPPQLNVYGPVPPVGVRLIAPVFPPLQATLVTTVVPETTDAGCAIVKLCEAVHPLASVAVTVHVPAVRPDTDFVPSPVGLPGFQS